jgi:hypothetical protein
MASFGYPAKHKQKTLEFAWQCFGTQFSLWVKINCDPMVRWRGLDKINVLWKYINYNFFYCHRAPCLWFMKHYQTKEKWKIMQYPSIKYPPLWYGSGFFL